MYNAKVHINVLPRKCFNKNISFIFNWYFVWIFKKEYLHLKYNQTPVKMIYLIVIPIIWIAFVITAIWLNITTEPEEPKEDVKGEVREIVFLRKNKGTIHNNLN